MQKKYLLFTLVAAMFLATPVHAQWYVGAGVGQSDAKLSEGVQAASQLTAAGFSNAQTSLDKRDSAFRVYGGYKFLNYFAAELGYTDLGTFAIRSTAVSAGVGPGSLTNETRIRGDDLSVLGSWPLGNAFSVFGRVGVFAAEAETSVSTSGAIVRVGSTSTTDSKKRGTQATYGLGAVYQLTPAITVRGEWSRFEKVKTLDVLGGSSDSSINLYTLGLAYHF